MTTLGRAAWMSAMGIRSRLRSLLRFMECGSKMTSVVVTSRCPPRATRPRAPVRMAGSEMNRSNQEAGRSRWFAGTLRRICASGAIVITVPLRFHPAIGLPSAYCFAREARWVEPPSTHGSSRKESLREVDLSAASSTGRSRLPASSSHRLAGSLGQGAGDGVGHETAAQGEDRAAPQGGAGIEESIGDETHQRQGRHLDHTAATSNPLSLPVLRAHLW